jgi:S-adenosylmethionine:tRNA ribosyltransferase-isomerase
MLTAAFAGPDHLRNAYREALDEGYSFLSYGDSMFIA